MKVVAKFSCLVALYSAFSYEEIVTANVASTDFSELEEVVRNHTGEIEQLKQQIAELKNQIEQLTGQGSLGDILFKQGRYEEARNEFIKSYKEAKGKDSGKTAESLYKLAQCFKKLNKAKEAKTTLKKLCADYSSSSFCEQAKKELKEFR